MVRKLEKLLLVEDNIGLRDQMKWSLSEEYQVLEAGTVNGTLDLLKKHAPRIICLDLGLENQPDKGLEVIDLILNADRRAKIIVITSNTNPKMGAEAVERGAFDFLQKPIEFDELKVILGRAGRLTGLEAPPFENETDEINIAPDVFMIGSSGPMRQIGEHIRKLAGTDVNVLITGESGTGKELCARAVHLQSSRREKPFVPFNCGAIPESLMESELFGYVKGAFTGANADKTGLIESAHEGTLFLDEIGDMPKNLQVKLLRFLEDQKLQRLGETKLHSVDVRLIVATNKNNLADENNPDMRADLYFRLGEFEINLPPLKKRGEDILLITRKILDKNRERFQMPRLRISPRAEKVLLGYNWPGNVRELKNKLNKASIICTNECIEPEDLQITENHFSELTLKEARKTFEKNFILNALKKAGGNLTETANILGISRPTLYDLIKKYDISVKLEAKIDS